MTFSDPHAQPSSPGPIPLSDAPARIAAALYAEMRTIAQRIFIAERTGHTLQPTAVVNEACMRIIAGGLPEVPREHQLALAGRILKQVLIDHARARDALKRGGGGHDPAQAAPRAGNTLSLKLDEAAITEHPTLIDFEVIHAALERLRRLHERQAEVVTLRIFAGLTMDQIAVVVGVSKRAIEGDWTVARAWLRRELADAIGAPDA